MLCSECKKNNAVIFIKNSNEDNSNLQGLCYSCASKKGINPIESLAKQANLSDKDIANLTNQLGSLFNSLSSNIEDIDEDKLNEFAERIENDEEAQGVPLRFYFFWNFQHG